MTATVLRTTADTLRELGWPDASIAVQLGGTEPASWHASPVGNGGTTHRRIDVPVDDAGPRLASLRHEIAHAFVRHKHATAPQWAEEGFARSMEARPGSQPMHLLCRLRRAIDVDAWFRDAPTFSLAVPDHGGHKTLACFALFQSVRFARWRWNRKEGAPATLERWARRRWQLDRTDHDRLQRLARWLRANPDEVLLRSRLRSGPIELFEIVELAAVQPPVELPLRDAIELAARAVAEHWGDDRDGWLIRGLQGVLCDYSLGHDDAHEVLAWVRARLTGPTLGAFDAAAAEDDRRVIADWRLGGLMRGRAQLRRTIPSLRLQTLRAWAQELADRPVASSPWPEWLAAVLDLCPDRRIDPIDRLCPRPGIPADLLAIAQRVAAGRTWTRDEVARLIGFAHWDELARAPGPRWWPDLQLQLLRTVDPSRR